MNQKNNSNRKHDVYSANVDESKSSSQSNDDKEPKDKDRGSEKERKILVYHNQLCSS